MYISTYVTRYIKDGRVVGFTIRYDPPSPPLQVYRVAGATLHRILPNGNELEHPPRDLSDFVNLGLEELKPKHRNTVIEDSPQEFKPEHFFAGNPLGEYDIL